MANNKQDAIQTVMTRNSFYRDGYRALLKVAVVQGVIISALIAITAVVAGFFRRGVVVDIINWPVLCLYIPSGGVPAGWRRVPPTLSM